MKDEILKRIDVLAEKLGSTADHIYGVLIAQARIELWTSIAYVLFGSIASWVCRGIVPCA